MLFIGTVIYFPFMYMLLGAMALVPLTGIYYDNKARNIRHEKYVKSELEDDFKKLKTIQEYLKYLKSNSDHSELKRDVYLESLRSFSQRKDQRYTDGSLNTLISHLERVTKQ